MATYGTGRTNIPFTGFTPTLGSAPSSSASASSTIGTTGTVWFNGYTQQDHRINALAQRGWGMKLTSMLLNLIGNGTPGAVNVNRLWVAGTPLNAPDAATGSIGYGVGAQGGGVVRIMNASPPIISRVLNANDVADLKTLFSYDHRPALPYPPDISTNGGGGKAGW